MLCMKMLEGAVSHRISGKGWSGGCGHIHWVTIN